MALAGLEARAVRAAAGGFLTALVKLSSEINV